MYASLYGLYFIGHCCLKQINIIIIITKPVEKKNVVDEFLDSHGHDMLQLPSYHVNLNL